MKRNLLLLVLSLFFTFSLMAQSDRFAYAITDVHKEGVNWSFLRRVDLATGKFSEVLLKGNDVAPLAYDAQTKKQMTAALTDDRLGSLANAAFGTGVAAIALDKKNNRLYYTPMFVDQLRYIDLRSMKAFFVNNIALTGMPVKASDQSNIVTRMAIGSDGYGYALTNDANHLIRFSTGKKLSVTDLGALIDDPANQAVSVHNSCTSFGGDMVADDNGHLYLFSARNQVFKVDLESRLATHLGAVTGLPANFTVNGAAVDENNQVLVTSAMDASAIFTVDKNSWSAAPLTAGTWRVADLANSNLLHTKKPVAEFALAKQPMAPADERVLLYPNPSTDKQFSLQLNIPNGRYTLLVTDVLGRETLKTLVTVGGKGQTERLQLSTHSQAGVYQVRLMDPDKNEIFSRKLLVQ